MARIKKALTKKERPIVESYPQGQKLILKKTKTNIRETPRELRTWKPTLKAAKRGVRGACELLSSLDKLHPALSSLEEVLTILEREDN